MYPLTSIFIIIFFASPVYQLVERGGLFLVLPTYDIRALYNSYRIILTVIYINYGIIFVL